MADEKQRALHQLELVAPETRAEVEASKYQSDQALICACRKGDTRAWGILSDRYECLVFTIALHYGLGQHDATALPD